MAASSHAKKLGWFLCWAVVFADIGTSLYYVPGILFGEVRNLAGLFVSLTSLVFVLLALKYIEISDRYPEGGGVVTVATSAFGSWFGALGGMFITVDYFLTASISSVSGFAYLNSIIPIGGFIVILSVIGLIFLGILNIIGIKESAGVTAVIAVAAFIVDIILVLFVSTQIGPAGWSMVFHSLTNVKGLAPWQVLTGFAGSFLAFSGLESISQLSPAMELPRKKIASIAMVLVIATILITSPILTLFSTNILTAKVKGSNETILENVAKIDERKAMLPNVKTVAEKNALEREISTGETYSESFISELGAQYGGTLIKIAVVITASVLLLFAANTAVIGSYHVFIALSRQNFLPEFFQTYNDRFETPHWSVIVAIIAPILIVLATRGNVNLLGELYAFGLLGAFSLSSIGLDLVRFRERKINFMFFLGILTSFLVVVAWGTNLYNKQLATIFGGGITILGMLFAFVIHKYFPTKAFLGKIAITPLPQLRQGQIFVPVFGEFDPSLFKLAGGYAKSLGKGIVLLYIREFSDVLQTVSEDIALDREAENFITKARHVLSPYDVKLQIQYDATTDTADSINEFRDSTKPSLTILSPHKRSKLMDFLKGDIVRSVTRHKDGNVLIHTGTV